MFGRIKNLFRRRSEEEPVAEPPSSAFPPREFHPGYTPGTREPAVAPMQSEPVMEEVEQPSIGDSIRLLLKPVLLKLPDALRTRVRQPPVGGVQISIPLQKVLSQLQQGSVRISFGELRQASPAGVFAELSDQDQTLVELPLAEILSQLKPDQLPRRAGQRKIEVPESVTGLFGSKGEPLTSLRMGGAAARPPAAAEPAAPIAPKSAPAATFKPSMPVPPSPAPAAPIKPAQPLPLAPIKPTQPLPSPAALRPLGAAPAAPVAPIPAAVTPAIAAPTLEPQPTPVPLEPLIVPLAQLSGKWPEAIRKELAELPDAAAGLPKDEVEKGLKRGKIAFPWQSIRSWITPALPPTAASALDDVPLDLPLHIVAPLFLAQRRPAPPQKKYTITENIPDVFAGRGREPSAQVQVATPITPSTPALPAAPVIAMPSAPPPMPAPPVSVPPAPAPAPALAPAPAPPALATARAAPKEIGEIFGQPGRKNWTPSEIVQKTSELNGVAGSLIAMPDGLLVAGHLPPGLNAETIAAFLPQMHSRITQYSKELRFGEANHLTLIVDDVPLKIFKTGGVFFTVLGRSGEPLPEQHLSIVAAQLGPQNK